METSRTRWLAGAGGALLLTGAVLAWRWPSAEAALQCLPEDVRFEEVDGRKIARCAPGTPIGTRPAGPGVTLGLKFDLNHAATEELTLVPGIGRRLAVQLTERRAALRGFRSWDEVDKVEGMGPSKLAALRQVAEIRESSPSR